MMRNNSTESCNRTKSNVCTANTLISHKRNAKRIRTGSAGLLLILVLCLVVNAEQVSNNNVCARNDDETYSQGQEHTESQFQQQIKNAFPGCRLYLAKSTLPNAGLGIFSGTRLPRGAPIAASDIVIQVTDMDDTRNPHRLEGTKVWHAHYWWDAQETAGQFEGRRVYSTLPGIGMLANGYPENTTYYNAIPFRPDVDEADLPRTLAAGSGSISHYHNLTYFARKEIGVGEEVFVRYNRNWFQDRQDRSSLFQKSNDEPTTSMGQSSKRSLDWLQTHGTCMDNLKAGRSTIASAGRGAFATRFVPKGAVIAPAPVLPITNRTSLDTSYRTKGNKAVSTKQLLLNYCIGHPKSSVLLYPYSSVVNFINHDSDRVNAGLRWSDSFQHEGRDWPENMSLEKLRNLTYAGLMMEVIALRDIMPNEEVFLDYEPSWVKAWETHVATWKPVPNAQQYSPAYVMENVATTIRTGAEQRDHPYEDNLITACFYRYSDNNNNNTLTTTTSGGKSETTAMQWQMKRDTFDYTNLRPCAILQREKTADGRMWYTVLIKNRHGLAPEERIPKGEMHVVSHVPRQAIRFADRLYTTDQHLPNTFRHEIGVPDDIFPNQWMDLA